MSPTTTTVFVFQKRESLDAFWVDVSEHTTLAEARAAHEQAFEGRPLHHLNRGGRVVRRVTSETVEP